MEMKVAFFLLALMCENVNAAPQALVALSGDLLDVQRGFNSRGGAGSIPAPAGVAPFTIGHPMCQTGFTIAMRFDERNSAGAIIKSVWVRKCVRVPRIVYGRKV